MKLIPFDHINYTTQLSSEEVKKRISDVLEPRKFIRMKGILASNNHKPFEGTIKNNEFEISTINNKKNQFAITKGLIKEQFNDGCNIELKIKIRDIFYLILGIGMIVFLVMFFSIIIHDLPSDIQFIKFIIPIIAVLISYINVLIVFNWERKKVMKDLTELLELMESEGKNQNPIKRRR